MATATDHRRRRRRHYLYGDYVTQIATEGRQLAGQAHERFSRLLQAHDVPWLDVGVAVDKPSAGWRDGEGLEDRVVGEYGRVFDVIVVGRTTKPPTGDWNTACEAALFESGRPVIVAPPTKPATLGENVLIAWNCSTETARTIALSMPFLERAKQVTVLTVEGGTVPGPSGEEIAKHLSRHGIPASAKTTHQQNRTVGEAILQEAEALGADFLVKGAYTQSRLRQMIFGGATRHLLTYAMLPLILAH
ncbi:MAG: universal stress protein [Gammaproteobacteria bacterium]